MSKFEAKKINSRNVEQAFEIEAAKRPDATVNAAGGYAISLASDPATKLITMVGGAFFNEPTYYGDNTKDDEGLTSLAQEVIDTAKAVAHSANPRDLLAIANWLRNEKNIRTTASLLYAIAAGEQTNQNSLRDYGPKILKRADDVLQAFGAYYNLYGSVGAKTTKRAKGDYTRMTRIAKLPNSFKKGLAAALSKFDEYQLLKWDSSGAFPTFKDVVLTVDRKGDYPINRSLVATWLNGGEIVNALETPLLAARKQLSKLKEFNATAQALALAGHVTWEIVLSQFGNTKAVWEFLIDGGKTTLPVMAAVRNLRNMEQADISDAHWKKLRELVLSSDDTKMMPFRFVSARNELTNRHAKGIAEACLDKAVLNLADLPGNTFIMVDHSGSMTSTVSEKSTMTKKDAGTALMAILAKKFGTNCVIGTFGKTFATVDFSVQDSVWRIFEDINKVGATTGHSTEAHLAFKWLLANANKYKADRVIIMSDLQCYNSYGSASLQSLYQQYRQTVNPKCRLVSVDIGGKGTSQVAPDPYVYLSSGYNDSIVKEIVAHEQKLLYNDRTDGGDKSNVPALDYVRTNF